MQKGRRPIFSDDAAYNTFFGAQVDIYLEQVSIPLYFFLASAHMVNAMMADQHLICIPEDALVGRIIRCQALKSAKVLRWQVRHVKSSAPISSSRIEQVILSAISGALVSSIGHK